MTALIAQTGILWRSVTGDEAEVIVDGRSCSAIEAWNEMNRLLPPLGEKEAFLLLENGARVSLPFIGLTYRIPNRTGVLAIFNEGEYIHPDGSDVFPVPNNAAIYNADGSLRFQLKLPEGHYPAGRIGGIHSGSMPERFKGMMGVVVATSLQANPEWVYAIDPNQPELIATHQWVRW